MENEFQLSDLSLLNTAECEFSSKIFFFYFSLSFPVIIKKKDEDTENYGNTSLRSFLDLFKNATGCNTRT